GQRPAAAGQVCQASRSATGPAIGAVALALRCAFEPGLLGHSRRPAQVARLDDLRLAVAVLPAGLDLDLVCFADETMDDVEAGAGPLDPLDLGLGDRQRQQRQDLTEVAAELGAEV